jgi:hypothetical protein
MFVLMRANSLFELIHCKEGVEVGDARDHRYH